MVQMANAIWPDYYMLLVMQINIIMIYVRNQPQVGASIRDQFNRTNLFTHGLTTDITALVKPIYIDLIRAEELKSAYMAKRTTKTRA